MKKGRVIESHKTNYIVNIDGVETTATVRGSFHAKGDFPKVGDYVNLHLLDDGKAVIETVEERSSVIKRKSADSDEEQIIITNVDKIFVVVGLDGDYSVNRIERYLLLAGQSEIPAVIILNKADEVDSVLSYIEEVESIAGESSVIAVSALTGENMDSLQDELIPGSTSVLLGSSGAGKSTITNWLLSKEKQLVREIRADDSRGRHTTTSRQLFELPNGSYLIDTPGMRELGIIEGDSENELEVFNRIEQFASQCKFRNCDHEKSSGCAVLEAVNSGELTKRELYNYGKIVRERQFQESKDSTEAARHFAQNQKRTAQKHVAILREKLRRRQG